ncbi:Ig-like domain-containing protein [Lactococcus garvieae]|uniref:Ig-like domain-containing protein n=1 Tax=Lactococcus garvieae TaxID=1363 RepID=UPI0022E221D2|nr:Ig-like domain-containing protein [Lactococcus garvieae]
MLKKFVLIFGLVLFCMTISMNAKADLRTSSSESINSLKTSYWSKWKFESFSGNNLTDDKFATPETTLLEFSRKSDALYVYIIDLKDSKGRVLKSVTISKTKTKGIMEFQKGTLKANEKYFVSATKKFLFGKFISTEKIIQFNVVPKPEIHTPPIIYANSRTVQKDDPSFDIKEGVKAYDEDGLDITNLVETIGDVNVHIPGIYPVKYIVKDKNGLSAEKRIEITVKSQVSGLAPPFLDVLTNNDKKVTGKGKPGCYIYVILGTEVYREVVNQSGKFTIVLEHPYPTGTGITAYLEDESGNQSSKVYEVVQAGSFTVGVNKVVSSDTSITGHTAPNSQVEVAVNNSRAHIFYGTSDGDGNFEVSMNGNSYATGTSIEITAKNNDQVSQTVSVIVYPKKVTINTLHVGDKVINGEADPNSIVHVTVNEKNYTFSTDVAGEFSGNIDLLQQGDKILAYQTSNGIDSDVTELIVNSRS